MEFNYENFKKLQDALENSESDLDRYRRAYIELLNLCDFDNSPSIPIEKFKLLDCAKWYIIERAGEFNVVRSLN